MSKQSIPANFWPKDIPAVREGKWDIYLKRQELRNNRLNNLSAEYQKRLDVFVDAFFMGVSDDTEANETNYHFFNRQWMQMAHKANRIQKVIRVDPKAFENNINHTIRVQKLLELEPQITPDEALAISVENVIKLLSVSDSDRKKILEMMLPKPTEETTMTVIK